VLDFVTGAERTLVHAGISEHFQMLYQERYQGLDLFWHGMMLRPIGDPATSDELVEETELLGSRIYREWAAPQDFRHVMLTALVRTDARLAFIGVTRTHKQARYTQDDKAAMALLAPHVRRAITIADLIDHKAMQRGLLAEVLDALSTAVLVLDSAGRPVHANQAGQSLLARCDVLVTRRNVIEPWSADDRAGWPFGPGRGGTKTGHTLSLARQGGGIALVSLLPLNSGRRRLLLEGGTRTALFFQEAELGPNAIEGVGAAFGLTAAELRILLSLRNGGSAADIADSYGIALTTVRTHIRSLFAKTGLNRQKDLVGLLAAAAPLRSPKAPTSPTIRPE
jgi:DNA-binding CsgD family transcriptional regulator/PAS domain-containing protein